MAASMGYRPHPLVSTLMAQLHHYRRRSDPHSIAWIDLWHGEEEKEPVMETRASSMAHGGGPKNSDTELKFTEWKKSSVPRNNSPVVWPPEDNGA